MTDYRRALDRESERFDLAPGALDRLFDRRGRKIRNQRIGAGLVALAVLAAGVWGAVSLLGGPVSTRGHHPPRRHADASPEPAALPGDRGDLFGHAVHRGPGGFRQRDGRHVHHAPAPQRCLRLSAPVGALREGPSPSAINYRLSGSQFTINAFVNISCPGTLGTYRWKLAGAGSSSRPCRRTARCGEPSSPPNPGSSRALGDFPLNDFACGRFFPCLNRDGGRP